MALEITYLSPAETLDLQEQILVVYGAAFALAPYNRTAAHVADFRLVLDQHARREGFRCAVARDEPSGAVLGFTCGHTGGPGQWWTDSVRQGMTPAMARRWLNGHFEFAELAVTPGWQGHGVGGQLHDALLAGLSHPTAVLSTIHAETPALQLYRRRGWRVLLRDFAFPGVAEPYLIMGLDLGARGRQDRRLLARLAARLRGP